ncbi:asparagine synthetase domain-containing protein 1 isoform X2 [Cynara cardunculus var. scolymus]|uniref:asparagine synthetase domain-containing protein 1 isoform X2 n=1 Tax=Cynara cardunculus var. scolymus TaxID=59895 RepID=UPI000D630812|nr:asparagine synthetase domain-containing protein 1 isoform X2 [Cynara cardunculus var. scolymus]
MCGIALIISGVRIDLSSLLLDTTSCSSSSQEPATLLFSADDIKAALRKRGPDSLGSKAIFLHADGGSAIRSSMEGEETTRESHVKALNNSLFGEVLFVGATLQLRGIYSITQPLVDKSGNILVYNVFGGIELSSDSNDAEVLMQYLGKCCNCLSHNREGACSSSGNGKYSVPELLSTIKGPWALIYWQASSKTIWFGRDALGRRSLLVHWPSTKDSRFMLSSVSPPSAIDERADIGYENGPTEVKFWEELPCAVYSLSMSALKLDENLVGEVRRHNWTDPMLEELIKWERTYVEPRPEDLIESHGTFSSEQQGHLHQEVLAVLKESVRRRTIFSGTHLGNSPVAVLFSGGLDSMILAALLDECLDLEFGIDLLNVSFDGQSAPDRISARAGVIELRKKASLRRWNLVEIDAELPKLTLETKHVMSLINPSNTYMDLNIGIALWLAAGGDGWVCEEIGRNDDSEHHRFKYKSDSRILLVGSGADEQCAGYGRHKTKYRQSGWAGLNEEMKLDMQRIWKRNLGRDDRCIADNGREARFPFLDEDVIRVLLDIPLWEIADLGQPSGVGDKKILREVARMLNLHEAAVLPKRAIQFGSRIARESNRKNFGSNRAANQASAGSALIHPI